MLRSTVFSPKALLTFRISKMNWGGMNALAS
jgi:hypothetical protein